MCIIVAKPKHIKIKHNILENCYNHNPDGAGFMYHEGRDLIIKKGFFTFDEFMSAYEPHESKTAVLHFRIKTHGDINLDMCHPFSITSNLAFAHNGVLYKCAPKDSTLSDTYAFNENYIKPLVLQYGKKILNDKRFKKIIEDFIGGSKLVFLDSRGNMNIYNENLGTTKDNVWFSNESFRTRRVYTGYSGYGGYGEHGGYTGVNNSLDNVGNRRALPQTTSSLEKKPNETGSSEKNESEESKIIPFPKDSGYHRKIDNGNHKGSIGRIWDAKKGDWKELKEANGTYINKGDLVEFVTPFDTNKWNFKKHDCAEVIAFGTGFSVWLKPFGQGNDSVPDCLVPLWSIRLWISAEDIEASRDKKETVH